MKKKDLKTGMQVQLRNGIRYLVLLNTSYGDIVSEINGFRWFLLYSHFDDMTYEDSSLDIMSVYERDGNVINEKISEKYCIWKRPKEKMITINNKEYSESTIKKALQEYVLK